MPEEVNRIMCDHTSTLLFSPTASGLKNLLSEGFKDSNPGPYNANNPKVYHCGDVMYDNSLYFSAVAESKTGILQKHGLSAGQFILATIHRNNNTDEPARLNALFKSLNDISIQHNLKVVLPLHPRTAKLLETNLNRRNLEAVKANPNMIIAQPASFMEMIASQYPSYCKI